EETLLEDRVAAVPERERKTQAALPVTNPQQAVLAPAVGTATSVVMREVIPRRAVRRVVLTHRPPLPLGEIRSPALPVGGAVLIFGEAPRLGIAPFSGVIHEIWRQAHACQYTLDSACPLRLLGGLSPASAASARWCAGSRPRAGSGASADISRPVS